MLFAIFFRLLVLVLRVFLLVLLLLLLLMLLMLLMFLLMLGVPLLVLLVSMLMLLVRLLVLWMLLLMLLRMLLLVVRRCTRRGPWMLWRRIMSMRDFAVSMSSRMGRGTRVRTRCRVVCMHMGRWRWCPWLCIYLWLIHDPLLLLLLLLRRLLLLMMMLRWRMRVCLVMMHRFCSATRC